MPNLIPAVPGDLVYPKYAAVTTEPISSGLQIIKGRVYTISVVADATKGTLIDLDNTSGSLRNGFFQAMETPESVGAATNDDTVQVVGARTRMLLIDAVGGLVVGDDVKITEQSQNVTTSTNTSLFYIGKIFEIYNLESDGITQKYVTEAGDKVIVETVQP